MSGEPVASKADDAYRQLKGEIESMSLAPGAKLGEIAVSQRLGISRTPVREALRRLMADGLVVVEAGEAARVAPVSLSSIHELFDFRVLIEPEAMARVARQVADGVADIGSQFEALRAAFTEQTGHLDAGQFYALAEQFDVTVRTRAANQYLAMAMRDVRSQTARLRTLSHTGPDRMAQSLQEHLEMCAAILAGDPTAAAEATVRHLRNTERALVAGAVAARSSVSVF